MTIDNIFMLKCFSEKDKVLYYNTCKDIMLAGNDYKVREIRYFIYDKSEPLSDYIAIKTYDDSEGFILVYAFTQNHELLCEAIQYLVSIANDVKEISLRTPFPEIFTYKCISDYFYLTESTDTINPIYFIHRSDELNRKYENKNVQINLATDKDTIEVREEEQAGRLDPEMFGEGIFNICSYFKDTKVFVMRVNGQIAGYLRAENGYSNIYDIGWVYVIPEYRGHSYAAQMVSFFPITVSITVLFLNTDTQLAKSQ